MEGINRTEIVSKNDNSTDSSVSIKEIRQTIV